MGSTHILVDTGAPGGYLDDQLVPKLRDWILDYMELETPREIAKVAGIVVDKNGKKRNVKNIKNRATSNCFPLNKDAKKVGIDDEHRQALSSTPSHRGGGGGGRISSTTAANGSRRVLCRTGFEGRCSNQDGGGVESARSPHRWKGRCGRVRKQIPCRTR